MILKLRERSKALAAELLRRVSMINSVVVEECAELLLWFGGLVVSAGVALIYLPAGVITFGLEMIIAGALIARSREVS